MIYENNQLFDFIFIYLSFFYQFNKLTCQLFYSQDIKGLDDSLQYSFTLEWFKLHKMDTTVSSSSSTPSLQLNIVKKSKRKREEDIKEEEKEEKEKVIGKKQKLYEIQTPFTNKNDEYRRQKAITARKHRVKQKEEHQEIIKEKKSLIEKNEALIMIVVKLLLYIEYIDNNNNNKVKMERKNEMISSIFFD